MEIIPYERNPNNDNNCIIIFSESDDEKAKDDYLPFPTTGTRLDSP